MLKSVVDIGSNSLKFSVAEVRRDDQGKLIELRERDTGSWITRLGRGLSQSGLLSEESILATDKALAEIAEKLKTAGAAPPLVVATSAVRDCKNPQEISALVQKHLGAKLRVISGQEEALYSVKGAQAALSLCRAHLSWVDELPAVFIDVGGASTETAMLEPAFSGHSFQAGAVRCHEGLGLHKAPLSDAAWAEAKARIEDYFPLETWKKLRAQWPDRVRVVGIGGTLLMAARMVGATKVGGMGYAVTRTMLETLNEEMRKLSFEKRLLMPGIQKGREDILCAGILCLLCIVKRLGCEEIILTEWGLRHGLLLES